MGNIRNELCYCGSGKKVKKCCEHSKNLFSIENYSDLAIGDDANRKFSSENQIESMTSISNLSKDTKLELLLLLSDEVVLDDCCFYTSIISALYYNKIKLVKGWIGRDLEMGKQYEHLLNSSQQFVRITDSEGILWIDTKNWIQYISHNWNEIDGFHFDLTAEGNPTFNHKCFYIYSEIIDLNPIHSNESTLKSFYLKTAHQIELGKAYGFYDNTTNLKKILEESFNQ
jgi:hypothetical protein